MVETGIPFWGAVAAVAVALAGTIDVIGAMVVAAAGCAGAAAKARFDQVAIATKHKAMSTASAVARRR
jgi:hypothetical protein